MGKVYYNEWNKDAAQWLRELVRGGVLPDGDIDERDIRDVTKNDLRGYTQCHFFAGIGGWPLAFRLAGWPDSRPVWSGSCPCGPYSIVGRKAAFDDPRDLWPHWFTLMDQDGPVIFGEQVADAIRLGWLDRTCDDVATQEKSVWPVVLPSCSTGQANKGERLFFVAASDTQGLEGYGGDGPGVEEGQGPDRYPAAPSLCDFIEGWDGRKRPVESGVHLLVNGLPERMVQIYTEGFGNAINPQVAAAFIKDFMRYHRG